ncbi:MAG: hypothetical protein KVP17_004834 [Porospora cf. gigantea B]|uniref:uncharacterized protein n=1 Tax=Porospora cf. gigantea B TaxID=2853592 RepID=UPI0035718C9D|nr:MAG: hypothetical protein KVP17_004834 [Porospora cf. gigantea B]
MTRLILELDQWTMKDSGVSEARWVSPLARYRPLGLGRLIRSLSSTAGKIQDEPMCLSTWMALFPEWRVWDVTFPGSHNSATYTRERIVTGKATAIVLPFLKKFIYCQDKAVYDQLCVGVRFFDLRVRKAKANSLNNEDPPWCAHAGYNTIALTTALAHIRQFLQKNPSEVVILSVRRDAGSTKKGCEVSVLEADFWLCKELRTYLGRCLGANTTVGELVARRQNVIYFYEEQERCIGESFKLILEPISKSKFRAIEPFDGDLQQLLLENGLDAAAKDAKKIPWSLSLEEFIKDAAKTNDDVHLSFEDPPQQEEDMEDNGECSNPLRRR